MKTISKNAAPQCFGDRQGGNIGAELDAYKRAQAITAKAAQKNAAAEHRMNKSLAKKALAELITP